jgi:hypothetical protein
MPTLIRFLLFLVFLAALAFGGMIALTALVEPQEKEITMRVPAQDLFED